MLGYLRVMREEPIDLAAAVAESGLLCGRCGGPGCARRHAVWYRKRITDLSTGAVFDRVPIVRVRFCDRRTASLMPAWVWRGRFVVDSVLETVSRVLRDGVEAAYGWTWLAGTGDALVSRRTLGRWRAAVSSRFVGSALSWLGPQLDFFWSHTTHAADQLDSLLDRLTGPVLLGFRAATGHAVLDKPQLHRSKPRRATRRIAGRPVSPVSPEVPSERLGRGRWCHDRRRGPPAADISEDETS